MKSKKMLIALTTILSLTTLKVEAYGCYRGDHHRDWGHHHHYYGGGLFGGGGLLGLGILRAPREEVIVVNSSHNDDYATQAEMRALREENRKLRAKKADRSNDSEDSSDE